MLNNFHTFAWDGFSFRIPADWNLAAYYFGKHESRIEMQDDFALRLQFDWTRPLRKLNEIRAMEQYEKACSKIEKSALSIEQLQTLNCWHASFVSLPDKKSFVIGIYIKPESNFFALVRIFFEKTGKTQPLEIFHRMADSFVLYDGDIIPWEPYDLRWELNRQFTLAITSLKAGNKFFQFHWRRRRLMLWQISMADWILKNKKICEWAVEFLSKNRTVEGVKFVCDNDNIVCVRRKYRFPLGHFEDIARLCYKYRAFATHNSGSNSILVGVYHYRYEKDITQVGSDIAEMLQKTPSPKV